MSKREDELLREVFGTDGGLGAAPAAAPGAPGSPPDLDALFGGVGGPGGAPTQPGDARGFLAGFGAGLAESGAGLVELPGLLVPGNDPFERTGAAIREGVAPPEGEELFSRGGAGRAIGRVLGEGAQLAVGGAGVARLGGAAAARLGGSAARGAVRIRRALQGPARALAAGEAPSAAQRAARLAAESLVFSPVDALVGLNRARLEGLDPVEAVAQEIALGAAGGAAFEAAGAGLRAIARPLAQRFVRSQELLEVSQERLLTREELVELEASELHPSAQALRASRGEALAAGSSAPVPLRSDAWLLDPAAPIRTRSGRPLGEGSEILAFGTRSESAQLAQLVLDPAQLPENVPISVFRTPVDRAVFQGLKQGQINVELDDAEEIFRFGPEAAARIRAGDLDPLETAIELRGLDAPSGELRVLRSVGTLRPHARDNSVVIRSDDAPWGHVDSNDLPVELRQELFYTRGGGSIAHGSLKPDAARRFAELTIPTPEQLAKRAPVLYHVTTRADLILKAARPTLIAQGRGVTLQGLAGDLDPAVSFTLSRDEAVMLRREFLRAGELARGEIRDGASAAETFQRWAQDDLRAAGASDEVVNDFMTQFAKRFEMLAVDAAPSPDELLGFFRAYLGTRDSFWRRLKREAPETFATLRRPGLLVDPLLDARLETYQAIKPEAVSIIALPTRELPRGTALLRRWGDTLQEIAVFGDVDVSRAYFVGAGALRQAPQAAQSGFRTAAEPIGLTLEDLGQRATARTIAEEIAKLAPETALRLVQSGALPNLKPEDVRGFTASSADLLLGEPGKPLDQATFERFREMLVALVETEPELAQIPKAGYGTVAQIAEQARNVRSFEELATKRALTPASLVAARNMVRGALRERLEALHKAASAAVGDERARLDLLIAREQASAMLLTKLYAGDISEAGLKLRLFREIAEAQQALDPNFWLDEARRILGDDLFTKQKSKLLPEVERMVREQDRVGLVRLLARLELPPVGERWIAYWKAGLLTNPKTHVVNVTSNLSFAALERLTAQPAALFDYVLSLSEVGRGQRMAFVGFASKEDLQRGSKLGRELASSIVRERRPSSPVAQRMYDTRVVLDNAKVDLRGRTVNFKLFSDPGFIEAVARGTPKQAVSAFAHSYVNGVFKALGASDAFFKGLAIDASLVQSAQRLARESRGAVTSEQLLKQWYEGHRAIPDEVVLDALLEASVRTFQDNTRLGAVFGAFQRIPGIGHFIVPFARVMGALLTRTLEYSGFGLAKGVSTFLGSKRALHGTQRHPPNVDQALRLRRVAAHEMARGATGASFFALGYWLHDLGLMSGSLPEFGTRGREIADAAGIGERSLYIPAEIAGVVGLPGGWFDITRIAPGGDVVALGAIMHQRVNDPNVRDVTRLLLPFLDAAELITSQPLAQGLRRLARTGEDPLSAANALILGLASSLVPVASAGVGAAARTIDPTLREDEGRAFIRFLTRIPWTSRTLPARLNAFGEPIERTPGVVANLLLPGELRAASDDPVLLEMARVGAGVARLERGTVAKPGGELGAPPVLEPEPLEAYQARQRLIGQAQYAAAQAAINSFTYQRTLPALVGQQAWSLEELQRAYIEMRTDAVRQLFLRDVQPTPRGARSEEQADAMIRFLFR